MNDAPMRQVIRKVSPRRLVAIRTLNRDDRLVGESLFEAGRSRPSIMGTCPVNPPSSGANQISTEAGLVC